MKLADVRLLHQSDFYRIVDFKCHCRVCSVTGPEYNNSFNISFLRSGFFEYRSFRRKDELHTGRVLISKPGYEHTTRHIDNQPDIVTIFDFRRSFYEDTILVQYGSRLPWILRNNDLHSLMVNSTPGLEYQHHRLLEKIKSGHYSALEIDQMVIRLLENLMEMMGLARSPGIVPDRLKQQHLGTVEAARDFILSHFREPLSLQQIATHCHVSPFHFSRIFKTISSTSPHQYLNAVRLNHARILVSETSSTVASIAYECGFNSPEHFVTAYRNHFKVSPSAHRSLAAGK